MGLWDIAANYFAELRGLFLTACMHNIYTGTMKRTTIFLTPDQIKRLEKVATRKAIKPAQLIRIYINAGLAKEKA
jgi:hypothetical protein